MESNDSQDNSSGKGWMEFMFIFSFVLIVIGLILDDTMASSDPGSFPLPSLEDFIGLAMIVIGGLMFLFTGLMLLLKRL
jgi:uncharacterized membrane protein YhaH (DUF805 family)